MSGTGLALPCIGSGAVLTKDVPMKMILMVLVVWLVVDVLFLVWWARLSRPDPVVDAMDSAETDSVQPRTPPSGSLLARALHLESRGNPSPSWLKGPRRRGVPSKLLKLGWLTRRRNRPAEDPLGDE